MRVLAAEEIVDSLVSDVRLPLVSLRLNSHVAAYCNGADGIILEHLRKIGIGKGLVHSLEMGLLQATQLDALCCNRVYTNFDRK